MTRLGAMQPYFFPYLGYFQLARAVDHFVFLDDVNFRSKGYLNRNAILQGNRPERFVLPVQNASQNRSIHEHYFADDHRLFFQTVKRHYASAPFLGSVIGLIERAFDAGEGNLARTNIASITEVLSYLGLPLDFSTSSQFGMGDTGQARIISLCLRQGADEYVNAPGGKHLYDSNVFASFGIKLRFLEPCLAPYYQPSPSFVASLSIIDALMWNDRPTVAGLVDRYSFS